MLLSIGATWCELTRAMEEETYADAEVAALIGAQFVAVRVDLDRRPDVFDRYTMGGSPSTVFLMPEGDIIAGVTFVDARQMKQILGQLATGFQTERAKILEEIRGREDRIAQVRKVQYPAAGSIGVGVFQNTVRGIAGTFDRAHGGFGKAPKYAMAESLIVLLQAFAETGGPDFGEILERTLDAIADRALFDPVEGGFFRCSTTEVWTVPHHAKMLADQAGLIRVFMTAAQLFDKPDYQPRAERAIEYALRTLKVPDRPLFYASQAADDHYYAPGGGRRDPKRAPPVDRTIYTEGNARMASALFTAAAAFGTEAWGDLAAETVQTLWETAWDADRGFCHLIDGGATRVELCRDAAWMAQALIDRAAWTGDRADLERAAQTLEVCHRRFWSSAEKGLLDQAAEDPFGEMKRSQKNIIENSAAAVADLKLAVLLEAPAHRERARKILEGFPNFVQDYGHYTAEFSLAVDRLIRPGVEIRLVGASPELKRAALGTFVPRKTIRHVAPDADHPPGHATVRRGEEEPVAAATPQALVEILKR